LINIEVPVPKAGLEQIRTLLISKREKLPPRSKIEIVGERVSDLVPHLIPAGLAIVAAMVAVSFSIHLFGSRGPGLSGASTATPSPAPPAESAAQAQASSSSSPKQPEQSPSSGESNPTPGASPTEIGSARFFPGQSGKTPFWAIFLVAIGILTPGVVRLSRRPGAVIEDSPAFVGALDKWFPFLISGRDMTPRAIKRFVNRVRYFAMMEGSFRPARRWWERLAEFLQKRKETAPESPTGTREDLLVALATVHERHPEWFIGQLDSFIAAFVSAPEAEKSSLPDLDQMLRQVSPDVYTHFKNLVAGVDVY